MKNVTMINFNNNVVVNVKNDDRFVNQWKLLGFVFSNKIVKFRPKAG